MQHQNHPELTSMEVLELWFAGRYWAGWHLGCIGWPVCLSAYRALSVYHLLGKYSVKCTLLTTLYVCQALLTSTFRGTPSIQPLRWITGQEREWTKGHLAQLQLPNWSQQTQSNPQRGLEECEAASPRKSGNRCHK